MRWFAVPEVIPDTLVVQGILQEVTLEWFVWRGDSVIREQGTDKKMWGRPSVYTKVLYEEIIKDLFELTKNIFNIITKKNQ